MTITQIRYFLETAKCKSFTRAAANNFVVQQVVSKQVKRLEVFTGCFFWCVRQKSQKGARSETVF